MKYLGYSTSFSLSKILQHSEGHGLYIMIIVMWVGLVYKDILTPK